MPIVEVSDVTKHFNGRYAVRRLNLSVAAGEIYTLLGPNGAGKTTTLRLIAGLLDADVGQVRVLGHRMGTESGDAKRHIAFLPDGPWIYARLRPMEIMEYVAGLWGRKGPEVYSESENLLKRLELWEHRDKYCEILSRGMQQKLAFASALIHKPSLLIFDEPLTGLDAFAARLVKRLLREHADAGGAVLLSTHLLDVAERIGDRIGILSLGSMLAEGTFAAIKEQANGARTLEDAFVTLVGHDGR